MTIAESESLPVGHRARPAVRTALVGAVLNAILFVVFGYVTTQAKSVRKGSPWQDDPYDAVVTFTFFCVPILVLLIVLRFPLCRRAEPLPLYRVTQLLRASGIATALVSLTYAADWIASATGAQRSLWDSGTPWLIGALGVVTVPTALAWLFHVRARRLLPVRIGRQEGGDWLQDAQLLADLLGRRFPRALGWLSGWMVRTDATAWIRRRFTVIVVVASLLGGVGLAGSQMKEDGFSSLFFIEGAWFAGGMFAFAIICDALLRLTVRPAPTGPLRRAASVAVTAGALALPVSMGLRRSIWSAIGFTGTIDTPAQYAGLTFSCALVMFALVFAVVFLRSARRR